MLHIWELNEAKAPYLYLTEGAHIGFFGFWRPVRTDWNLVDPLPELCRSCGSTLGALTDTPDAIREIPVRPSLRRRLLRRFKLHDKSELQATLTHGHLTLGRAWSSESRD